MKHFATYDRKGCSDTVSLLQQLFAANVFQVLMYSVSTKKTEPDKLNFSIITSDKGGDKCVCPRLSVC